jgi:hypothetical protein
MSLRWGQYGGSHQGMLFRAIILVQICHTLLWLFRIFDTHEFKTWTDALWGIVYGPDGRMLAYDLYLTHVPA